LNVHYEFNNQILTTIINPRIIFYAAGFASDFTRDELIVDGITERTIAGLAGMENGDRILSVQETPVTEWSDVASVFSRNLNGQLVSMVVARGSQEIAITLTPYEEAVVISQGVPLVWVNNWGSVASTNL
jgi:membrane-associated protease RseP (regulator of RpoE activity)